MAESLPNATTTNAPGAGDAVAGTLADRAFHAVLAAIVDGDLAPGTKISEPELARQYGTSRGPLREAINRLEARRLVERVPHVGARVVSLSLRQLIDIYQVRETLEGQACRLAASHMPDDEVADLRAVLDAHAETVAASDGQAYRQQEGDLDFHFRIARGSGNALLAQLLCDDLYDLMRMYRQRFSSAQGRPDQALREHGRILDAIAARDGELAELLMRRHIAAARAVIEERWMAHQHASYGPPKDN